MTEDFKTFERHGAIVPPEEKDAAFFPRQFGGRWALIHRPVPRLAEAKANMWLSFSKDLRHWGDPVDRRATRSHSAVTLR